MQQFLKEMKHKDVDIVNKMLLMHSFLLVDILIFVMNVVINMIIALIVEII